MNVETTNGVNTEGKVITGVSPWAQTPPGCNTTQVTLLPISPPPSPKPPTFSGLSDASQSPDTQCSSQLKASGSIPESAQLKC